MYTSFLMQAKPSDSDQFPFCLGFLCQSFQRICIHKIACMLETSNYFKISDNVIFTKTIYILTLIYEKENSNLVVMNLLKKKKLSCNEFVKKTQQQGIISTSYVLVFASLFVLLKICNFFLLKLYCYYYSKNIIYTAPFTQKSFAVLKIADKK